MEARLNDHWNLPLLQPERQGPPQRHCLQAWRLRRRGLNPSPPVAAGESHLLRNLLVGRLPGLHGRRVRLYALVSHSAGGCRRYAHMPVLQNTAPGGLRRKVSETHEFQKLPTFLSGLRQTSQAIPFSVIGSTPTFGVGRSRSESWRGSRMIKWGYQRGIVQLGRTTGS